MSVTQQFSLYSNKLMVTNDDQQQNPDKTDIRCNLFLAEVQA